MTSGIVATPSGPVPALTVDECRVLVALVRRFAEVTPDGPRLPPAVRSAVDKLERAWRMAEEGRGFRIETKPGGDVTTPGHDLLSAKAAAEVLGISVQAVARGCRNGKVPGARQVAGAWLLPRNEVQRWQVRRRR